jgi:hypothetical protein
VEDEAKNWVNWGKYLKCDISERSNHPMSDEEGK